MSTTQTVLTVGDTHLMSALVGPADAHLRRIEDAFADTDVKVRGNEITLGGPESDRVAELFRSLIGLVTSGHPLDETTVARSIDMVRADEVPLEVFTTDVLRAPGGRVVRPKSAGQKRYVDAIADNVITFGLGPAGTGKSWLAVATAVQALNAKVVDRIILTRPAVEAGERLGFLPGDLMAKVDPYLRPLFDALYDTMDPDRLNAYMERGPPELEPLAFIRRRTLDEPLVIHAARPTPTPRPPLTSLAPSVPGPKVVRLAAGTDAATVTLDDLQEMGFSICLYAATTLFAGLAAQRRALETLRAAGHVAAIPDAAGGGADHGLVHFHRRSVGDRAGSGGRAGRSPAPAAFGDHGAAAGHRHDDGYGTDHPDPCAGPAARGHGRAGQAARQLTTSAHRHCRRRAFR